jgi:hypothetical protein
MTSALDAGEWSASRPCHFTPGESDLSAHWIWGWVGRSERCGVEKNLLSLPGIESRPTVQPVACRYTEWAILAVL